jgi:serine/threonine protein phosphatase PrpC
MAAATVTEALSDWLASWPAAVPPEPPDVAAALRMATIRAQQVVAGLAVPERGSELAPSCTFAAAVVAGGTLSVGWLGDSRVYLLGPQTAVRMTADDTVGAEAARAGIISPEEAEKRA